jgi:type II secretion system protein N
MKRFFTSILIGLLIVIGLWHIAIPDRVILHLFNRALEPQGLSAEMTGIKKGFFFSFISDRLKIQKSGITLISVENVHYKIDFFSLLNLRLSFLLSGDLGKGKITARSDLLWREKIVNIKIEKAEIEGNALLSAAGTAGSGLFSGDLKIINNSGEFSFSLTNAKFQPSSFGGIPLPLEFISDAKGLFSLNSDDTEIKSLTLEGDGIFVRIKGKVASSMVDLNIELMPERSFMEKNPIFYLLEQYRISPGYYVIPIGSNVSFKSFPFK